MTKKLRSHMFLDYAWVRAKLKRRISIWYWSSHSGQMLTDKLCFTTLRAKTIEVTQTLNSGFNRNISGWNASIFHFKYKRSLLLLTLCSLVSPFDCKDARLMLTKKKKRKEWNKTLILFQLSIKNTLVDLSKMSTPVKIQFI